MPIFKGDAAKGLTSTPNPLMAGADYTMRYSMAVPQTGMLVGDILELAYIPPGCRVTNIIIDIDDIDSGTGVVFDVGIMSGKWQDEGARTCGNEFVSGATTGQTGGVVSASRKEAYRTAPAAIARSIGVRFSALAQTPVAGQIGITVSVAA